MGVSFYIEILDNNKYKMSDSYSYDTITSVFEMNRNIITFRSPEEYNGESPIIGEINKNKIFVYVDSMTMVFEKK